MVTVTIEMSYDIVTSDVTRSHSNCRFSGVSTTNGCSYCGLNSRDGVTEYTMSALGGKLRYRGRCGRTVVHRLFENSLEDHESTFGPPSASE